MIPPRHFFCSACDEGVTLRARAGLSPRCPRCFRDTLQEVNAPSRAPVAREAAREAFAAMRQQVMQATG